MGQQQQNGSSGKSIRTCSLGCWNGCLISRVPLKSGEKRPLRASKWLDSLGESKDTAELGCPGGSGQFLLKFGVAVLELGDSLLGGLQLTLYGRDQIDQPIGVDPSAEYIGLELLDRVHTCFLADSADCGKTCFTEFTATPPR